MKRLVVTVICLAAAPFITACDTGTAADDEVEADLTTVEGAILSLQQCWEEADIDTYAGVFTDEFIFYFDPQDVDHGLPPSWDLQDELDAAGNIFDKVGANNIELTLIMPDGFDEPEDDTCTINGVAYDIRVAVPDDDTIYPAQGMCNFSLEKSDGEWRFDEWYDLVGYRLLGGELTSWGAIKALD